MKENAERTNKVSLRGKISSDFQFSHKSNGVCYYIANIDLERTSGYIDCIPVMVSQYIGHLPEKGSVVCIKGQFQSANKVIDGQRKLLLNVSALEVKAWDKRSEDIDKNHIYLNGYICKEPLYRVTPLGRSISDVCIAVNSSQNHSDYLPCIFWGSNAKIVSNLPVGCQIKIWGRIQSRQYFKKIELDAGGQADGGSQKAEEKLEGRTAYEVSVTRIKCVLCHIPDREKPVPGNF